MSPEGSERLNQPQQGLPEARRSPASPLSVAVRRASGRTVHTALQNILEERRLRGSQESLPSLLRRPQEPCQSLKDQTQDERGRETAVNRTWPGDFGLHQSPRRVTAALHWGPARHGHRHPVWVQQPAEVRAAAVPI